MTSLVCHVAAGVAVLGGVLAAGCGRSTPAGSEPTPTTGERSSALSSAPATTASNAELERLTPGLLNAEVLGVPADWAVRDLDFTVADDADQFADTDPFLGLLQCPDGTVREGSDRRLAGAPSTPPRRYPSRTACSRSRSSSRSSPPTEWDEDRAALDDCTTAEQAEVAVVIHPARRFPSRPTPSTAGEEDGETGQPPPSELLASPTADVPYPSAFNATTVNVDEHTVTVIVGGIDMGESWQRLADDIAVAAISGLASTRPPPDHAGVHRCRIPAAAVQLLASVARPRRVGDR